MSTVFFKAFQKSGKRLVSFILIVLLLSSPFASLHTFANIHPIWNDGDNTLPPRPDDPVFDYLAEGVHPRLLVRPGDLPGLRTRITNPELSVYYNQILNYASAPADGNLPPRDSSNTNADSTKLRQIESKAFMYLLDPVANEACGHEAIKMMKEYMETFDYTSEYSQVIAYYRGIAYGDVAYTGAIVYDWCYDLLDIDEKYWFVERLKYFVSNLEFGYPSQNHSVVSGHASESGTARDFLAAGIAVADEDWTMYYDAARIDGASACYGKHAG